MRSSNNVYILAFPQPIFINLTSFLRSEIRETNFFYITNMTNNVNQLNNTLNKLNIYKKWNKTKFLFLRLSVNLLIKILNILSQYYELKALRLICQHSSDFAKSYLYYRVDLNISNNFSVNRRIQRINPRVTWSKRFHLSLWTRPIFNLLRHRVVWHTVNISYG